jgi:hypothetical protein
MVNATVAQAPPSSSVSIPDENQWLALHFIEEGNDNCEILRFYRAWR